MTQLRRLVGDCPLQEVAGHPRERDEICELSSPGIAEELHQCGVCVGPPYPCARCSWTGMPAPSPGRGVSTAVTGRLDLIDAGAETWWTNPSSVCPVQVTNLPTCQYFPTMVPLPSDGAVPAVDHTGV